MNDFLSSSSARWFLDRIPDTCYIETDAHGIFTHFGPGAEAFFACAASEALGKLKYTIFHDPAEMEACRGGAEFKAALESPGWTEELWTVIPRAGEPFTARVTLVPIRMARTGQQESSSEITGWRALYRRVDAGSGNS